MLLQKIVQYNISDIQVKLLWTNIKIKRKLCMPKSRQEQTGFILSQVVVIKK